jgi:hypothetical protein
VTKVDRWVALHSSSKTTRPPNSPVGVAVDCSIRDELDLLCNDRISHWTQLSQETQSSFRRLEAARQLVTSLGIETMQP